MSSGPSGGLGVEAPKSGWDSGQTIGLLTASAVLVALLALVETRPAAPLVPLHIFHLRTLVGGNLVLAATAVMTVGAVVGSTAGQTLVTRFGFGSVAAGGLVPAGAGCLILTQVSVGGSYWGDIFLGLLIFGPGLGATYVAASVATLVGVAEQESGLASALNQRGVPDRRRARRPPWRLGVVAAGIRRPAGGVRAG